MSNEFEKKLQFTVEKVLEKERRDVIKRIQRQLSKMKLRQLYHIYDNIKDK